MTIWDTIIVIFVMGLLISDIILTIKKIKLESKLWDLIKNGEMSYIRALSEFSKLP